MTPGLACWDSSRSTWGGADSSYGRAHRTVIDQVEVTATPGYRADPRSIRLGSREIPVVLPSLGDPRLRLAVVIVSLQVLGQTGLAFKVSVAQILVSIGVCAVVEMVMSYRRQHALVWPASAMLTGNSVAFILCTPGTRHGDWWSLNGIEWFVLASLIGILSKYVIRLGDRHLFNPSNFGLVFCFLIVGVPYVFPQYLWWGPMSPPVDLALAVILVGAVWVLWPLRMLPMAVAFLLPFGVLIAASAAGGRCFYALWNHGPICGTSYWLNICASPELLVFVFFMISDPKTSPRLPVARELYGVAVGVLAAALIFFQPSEYGIKVALLASLTVVCCTVPLMDHLAARMRNRRSAPDHPTSPSEASPQTVLSFVAVTVVVLTVPILMVALSSNQDVVNVDRGIVTRTSPSQTQPAG
jgi:Na+-transporting NADH:ubiquinone oxidoreductase subunit NqrB